MPMQDGGTYWVAKQGDKMVAGIFEVKGPDFVEQCPKAGCPTSPSMTSTRASKKATAAGANLMRPLFDIPGIGRIAILREPGGAGVGWMTPVTA